MQLRMHEALRDGRREAHGPDAALSYHRRRHITLSGMLIRDASIMNVKHEADGQRRNDGRPTFLSSTNTNERQADTTNEKQ